MEQSTMSVLCEQGGAQKRGARKAEPNSLPNLLIGHPIHFTAVYKRNGEARGQEYLRENSSQWKLEVFGRSTLSFFTPAGANLGD